MANSTAPPPHRPVVLCHQIEPEFTARVWPGANRPKIVEIIALTGNLRASTAAFARPILFDWLDSSVAERIFVDLSRVEGIDTDGVDLIISIHERANRRGRRCRLGQTSQCVAEALESAGAESLW